MLSWKIYDNVLLSANKEEPFLRFLLFKLVSRVKHEWMKVLFDFKPVKLNYVGESIEKYWKEGRLFFGTSYFKEGLGPSALNTFCSVFVECGYFIEIHVFNYKKYIHN